MKNDDVAARAPAEGADSSQRQVRIRVDERDVKSAYSNAFRTNTTAEEVFVDFGVNLVQPQGQGDNQPAAADMVFQVHQRVILNYYSAKRLAIALGQVVRRYEEQFGEIEMDAAKRQKPR